MIFTLNFHKFLHTVYKYLLNSVVKVSLIFAQYFEYCTIILEGGAFFRGHAVVWYMPWPHVCICKHLVATGIRIECANFITANL